MFPPSAQAMVVVQADNPSVPPGEAKSFPLERAPEDHEEDPKYGPADAVAVDIPAQQSDTVCTASTGHDPPVKASRTGLHHRVKKTNVATEHTGELPRQPEVGTVNTDVAEDEVAKLQRNVAVALLTCSVSSLTVVKATTNKIGGGEKGLLYVTIISWYISLLCSVFAILLNTYGEPSRGLVMKSKFINAFGLCAVLAAVTSWILI